MPEKHFLKVAIFSLSTTFSWICSAPPSQLHVYLVNHPPIQEKETVGDSINIKPSLNFPGRWIKKVFFCCRSVRGRPHWKRCYGWGWRRCVPPRPRFGFALFAFQSQKGLCVSWSRQLKPLFLSTQTFSHRWEIWNVGKVLEVFLRPRPELE